MTSPRANEPAYRKAYVLYDGRAEVQDTDDCCVLEFVGHSRRAVKDALYYWRGHDGVLVEYDDDGGTLINERIIGHLRKGKQLLAELAKQKGGTP